MKDAITLQTEWVFQHRGGDVTYKHVTGGQANFDPATGKVTESRSTETVRAAFTEINKDLVDGQMIQLGDKEVWISARSVSSKPQTDDEIEDQDGNVYTVVNVETSSVENEAVMYTLLVRGS